MAEHKYFDVFNHFSNTNPILGGGNFQVVSNVPQGTTDITRIGDKTSGTSVELRVEIDPPMTAAQGSVFAFRLIMFIWKDDTTPTLTQVIQSGSLTEMLNSPLDHDLKVKRRLIHDCVYYGFCDTGSGFFAGSYQPYTNVKNYFPLKKYGRLAEVNFISATTTAINHIYYVVFTPIGAIGMWNVNVTTRYNFIDM